MKIPIKYNELKGSLIFLRNENRQHGNKELAGLRGFLDLSFLISFISDRKLTGLFAESSVRIMACQRLIQSLQPVSTCTASAGLYEGWGWLTTVPGSEFS